MKYRKKPVVIEAYQTEKEVVIHTFEGDMKANIGDYIITGVNGEQYPCKPDIFHKTYESVSNAEFDHSDNEIIKALECWIKNFDGNATEIMALCGAFYLINRQQAEIERVKAENNRFADIGKMYSEIRAEARKEFAERLKEEAVKTYYGELVLTEDDINNLLKEMG